MERWKISVYKIKWASESMPIKSCAPSDSSRRFVIKSERHIPWCEHPGRRKFSIYIFKPNKIHKYLFHILYWFWFCRVKIKNSYLKSNLFIIIIALNALYKMLDKLKVCAPSEKPVFISPVSFFLWSFGWHSQSLHILDTFLLASRLHLPLAWPLIELFQDASPIADIRE